MSKKHTDKKLSKKMENLATPFRPEEKYGMASTAFAAMIATESDGVTKNLILQVNQAIQELHQRKHSFQK